MVLARQEKEIKSQETRGFYIWMKMMTGCNFWTDFYKHEEHRDEISSYFAKLEGPLSQMYLAKIISMPYIYIYIYIYIYTLQMSLFMRL
jgi:hypothetical protein